MPQNETSTKPQRSGRSSSWKVDGEAMACPLLQHLMNGIIAALQIGHIIVSTTSNTVTNQSKPMMGTQDSKCSQQVGSTGLGLALKLGAVLWHCTLNQGSLIPSSSDVRIDLSLRTPRGHLW